jgi:hypothetical protein
MDTRVVTSVYILTLIYVQMPFLYDSAIIVEVILVGK